MDRSYCRRMTQTAVGTLVRDGRQRRSRSQLDVAYDSPVSCWIDTEMLCSPTRLPNFTILTTVGTPRDITLDELAIELFFPNDTATATHFPQAATTSTEPT